MSMPLHWLVLLLLVLAAPLQAKDLEEILRLVDEENPSHASLQEYVAADPDKRQNEFLHLLAHDLAPNAEPLLFDLLSDIPGNPTALLHGIGTVANDSTCTNFDLPVPAIAVRAHTQAIIRNGASPAAEIIGEFANSSDAIVRERACLILRRLPLANADLLPLIDTQAFVEYPELLLAATGNRPGLTSIVADRFVSLMDDDEYGYPARDAVRAALPECYPSLCKGALHGETPAIRFACMNLLSIPHDARFPEYLEDRNARIDLARMAAPYLAERLTDTEQALGNEVRFAAGQTLARMGDHGVAALLNRYPNSRGVEKEAIEDGLRNALRWGTVSGQRAELIFKVAGIEAGSPTQRPSP